MLKIGFLKEKLFRKIEISSFKTQNFIWAKNSQISAFKSNSKALNLSKEWISYRLSGKNLEKLGDL